MLKILRHFILGSFLISATLINARAASEDSPNSATTHLARVISPRAIVYSDEAMNSPLGYISADKLITVGNKRKRNPELVGLVLYGRLAFIETKNIRYEDGSDALESKRGAPREHNIDIILAKPEEKLLENNSAFFSFQRFSAGEETKNIFNSIDNTTDNNFVGYGISLIHRQSKPGKVFWGAGYEYNTLSSSNVKFNVYFLNPIIGYTPIKNSLFLLDLTFSLDLSISAQLEIKNNFTEEPSGFIWGPQFGARVVLFPNQKYHAFGTFSYRSYKVLRLVDLVDANDTTIGAITRMSGINLGIGLAIEI